MTTMIVLFCGSVLILAVGFIMYLFPSARRDEPGDDHRENER